MTDPRPPGSVRPNPPAQPATLTDSDFDLMFRSMWDSQVRIAALLLRNTAAAEDAVQQAFAAVYRRWHSMRDLPGAQAYARTAVINATRSAHRRELTGRRFLNRTRVEPVPAADAELLQSEADRALLAALAGLSNSQREVLILRYYAGLSEIDISQTLNMPRGTVKSHAARGLAALRKVMEANR
ncbi:MAG TPA: sigma-70 family RNA polymerase sigma factor [Jatrophihabitans sp.]|nr:sigma-70 family RNA polymerase sigma factor [Jatrophihabitans sp.]